MFYSTPKHKYCVILERLLKILNVVCYVVPIGFLLFPSLFD